MRNRIHSLFLAAAGPSWILSVCLGQQSPVLGFFGTCCTLGCLALAMKTSANGGRKRRMRPS